jgi:hypothetical protein
MCEIFAPSRGLFGLAVLKLGAGFQRQWFVKLDGYVPQEGIQLIDAEDTAGTSETCH